MGPGGLDLRARLAGLGLALPPTPRPVAAYAPGVRVGDLVVVSGQLPIADGRLVVQGPVSSVVGVDQAKDAARLCVLNALAVTDDLIGGDWGLLRRMVRLGVFVASDQGFTDQPKVADGASELLVGLFGQEAGRHARLAVGVHVLPLGATVEVELAADVR